MPAIIPAVIFAAQKIFQFLAFDGIFEHTLNTMRKVVT
jgi:hypothetical protein